MKSLTALPLYAFLLVDVLNGFWALVSPGSSFTMAALAIKALVLACMAIFCKWRPASLLELCVIVLALCWILVVCENNTDSLILALKTASVVALFIVLDRYSQYLTVGMMMTFLRTSLLVVAVSLVLGLLGFGHERYGERDGVGLQANGFLMSGNEINIVLVGLFWWLASLPKRRFRINSNTILYWLCLALMVVSQSKTTIVSAFLIIFYFQTRRKLPAILLFISVVPLLAYLFLSSAIWQRWSFNYTSYINEGILSAFTGGRFGRIGAFTFDFSSLLARGASILANGGGNIESDPFDLLFNFGIAGLVLYALFFKRLRNICAPSSLPWLLVLFASIFAGHVIYSIFAAPILFCAFAVASISRSKQQNGDLRVDRRLAHPASSPFLSQPLAAREISKGD